MTSAIEAVLWPGLRAKEPTSKLGGILARKSGYHNSRDHLPPDDYSVQLSVDKVGPADEGSALDWTFPEAQQGDYRRISKYSRRLMEAGRRDDTRCYCLREFFGNTDNDDDVEGWSYYRQSHATSDKSHLWHIHLSIHRKYINSTVAMNDILSIIFDESLDGAKTVGMTASERKQLITEHWARDTNPDSVAEKPAWVALHEARIAAQSADGNIMLIMQRLDLIEAALERQANSGVTQEMLDIAVKRALRSIPE